MNYIQTNRYQLIICDYNLPEINGIELIQYIQSKGFKGQVFLFTGNPAILALSNLYKDELIRVIEKPILDIEAFKNKILSVFLNKSMSKKYEICL